MLDPVLLRIRTFSVANVLTMVAAMGFYAYLLNNILWLYFVWDWSLLAAGLAVAPGALVAAAVAAVLGRVADERGHRVVVLPGALVWAAAYVWYVTRVGDDPAFLSEWLPGQVLSGLGVGATLPILGAAALAAVPGARYATASAVVSGTFQLGAVLGVALLVVIVGAPSGGAAADAFREGWAFSAVCFAAVAAGALLLRREESIPEVDDMKFVPVVETGALADVGDADQPRESAVLFRLPVDTHASLLSAGEEIIVRAGEWLFREGDTSDALYVLRTGRLEVVMDDELVRELAREAVVGELGVLTGAPRSADIRARRDSRLVRVAGADLEAALDADAGAQRALTTLLAEQLQRARVSDGRPSSQPRVVAVVGAGSSVEVGEQLVSALARHVRVAAPGRVDAGGLERAERDNDRVVLVATTSEDESWRRFLPPPGRPDRVRRRRRGGTARRGRPAVLRRPHGRRADP